MELSSSCLLTEVCNIKPYKTQLKIIFCVIILSHRKVFPLIIFSLVITYYLRKLSDSFSV